jgi:Fic family protein
MPAIPPPQGQLWQDVVSSKSFPDVMNKVSEPTVLGKYVHWDKLRHLTPPVGLDHRAWWLGLKLRRTPTKRIPLKDRSGGEFAFSLPDPLPESLHHVDSLARGSIKQPEPITSPETRDSYMVRSLIEESITSSQLEGASTTREVAKKMIREGREPRDRSERMIMNNYRTMKYILEIKDRKIDMNIIFDINRMVTSGTMDDPTAAGRFRRTDENIVVGDDSGEVFHVPPPAEQLEQRIQEMCNFADCQTPSGFIHPMLRSIIIHFWLAYDHPFVDGNGRTARALFYWSMLKQGYWLFEYIAISRIILKAPIRYGRAFLYCETDENDLTYFLLYHAEVIRRAIDELHEYIERRSSQLAAAQRELRGLTTLNHRQRELISHVLRHPGQSFTIDVHRNNHNIVYETARSDMMELADRGLMNKRKIGRTWLFSPSIDLEERLRRPN